MKKLQILKENKDKKEAEFNERFKHRKSSISKNSSIFCGHFKFSLIYLTQKKKGTKKVVHIIDVTMVSP